MTYTSLRRAAWLLSGAALLLHLALVLPLPAIWQGSAAVLLLLLPGVLLALVLFGGEGDPLLQVFLGICGGVAHMALLLFALHAIPGPLHWWLVLLASDVISAIHVWLLLRRQAPHADPPRQPQRYVNVMVIALVLLGASLRLTHLGSAEFQGDEGRAMLMASGVMNGQDEMPVLHKKGPVEILLPAGVMALSGQINEWGARLPFAIAGLGVVLSGYALARTLFRHDEGGPKIAVYAGLVAALALTVDGFLMAFSRIVQYQSVLVLVMAGALWCCWRFYEGAEQTQRYLIAAAALSAVGLLAHYDAVFPLPALAWLVLAGGWRRSWRPGRWLRELAAPLLTGVVLLASFYVPFVLNERFERTMGYLADRAGHDGLGNLTAIYNNLSDYYRTATLYNTTFQIRWFGLTLVIGLLVWLCMYGRPRVLGWLLAGVLLATSVTLVQRPEFFALDRHNSWVIIPVALPLAGLALSPATPAALRALVLWFGLPFVVQSFLVRTPNTHFYIMHVPAALLIGLTIARLAGWLGQRRLTVLQAPLAAGVLGLLLLAAPYLYIVFVRQEPNYRRTFPESRPEIYRAEYGDELPSHNHFGFPHRSGWKAIGDLYQRGVLQGDYNSNDEAFISGWYTRGAFRCYDNPMYYFVATHPEGRVRIASRDDIRASYHLFGTVVVNGETEMEIYSREPPPQGPQVFSLDDHIDAFDARPVGNFPIQRSLIEIVPQYHVDAMWQRNVLLRGYDLDRLQLTPGQISTLVLYWRTDQMLDGYELVVEVLDANGNVVQHPREHCEIVPPPEWHTHRVNGTPFVIQADAQMPPGEYSLRAGIRHGQTGEWLPMAGGAEQLVFAKLTVVAPEAEQG